MRSRVSDIIINAPAQRVWEAITKPELVKQWQYGSDLITNWKPGSPIKYHSEWQGTVYEQWGTVLEVTPNKLLKYTLFAPRPGLDDRPENYFTMTYELTEMDDMTKLTITQDDPREQNELDSNDDGHNSILDGLKILIENKQ